MTQEEWTEVFTIQRFKITNLFIFTFHVILLSLLHVVKVGVSTKYPPLFKYVKGADVKKP